MKKTSISLIALTALIFTVSTSAMAQDPSVKNGLVILTPEKPEQVVELTMVGLDSRMTSPVEYITVVTMGEVGNIVMEFSTSDEGSERSWFAPTTDLRLGLSVAGPNGKAYHELSMDDTAVDKPEIIDVPIDRTFSYLTTGTVLLNAPELTVDESVTLRVIIRIGDSYCGGCI